MAVLKSNLVGWEQNQLDVLEILEKHRLKSVYAFNSGSGRKFLTVSVPPGNGWSIRGYNDGNLLS
ncbi:hypothetical protein SLEP1_g4722 [Rubroshorea leprosula]|uniref:Uncharacterized protein n=1 Tax=Rubroshorea leprosula TaxID=152421 RepID=A0AAV5HZD5_9ROSI|nr:hypothetical protein SLEP1_g4722 [Rubroshorea leprosula]